MSLSGSSRSTLKASSNWCRKRSASVCGAPPRLRGEPQVTTYLPRISGRDGTLLCPQELERDYSSHANSLGTAASVGRPSLRGEPAVPVPGRLCDNLEEFVTLSCRNLEAFLFCSLLF